MSVTTRLRSLLKRRHPLAVPLTAGYLLARSATRHKLLTGFLLLFCGTILYADYCFWRTFDAAYFPHKSQVQEKTLRVTFLDVGKGDAAVIETPDGRTMVIDAGSSADCKRVILPYLKRHGSGRIDALLLTHPHSDHIGGAIKLMKTFAIGILLENGAEDKQMQKVRDFASSHDVPVRILRRGDTLNGGSELTVKILSPAGGANFRNKNDHSLVMRLQYGSIAFLFTGDAQEDAEKSMVSSGQDLSCSVLKVGHHGNRHSTTETFLNKVKPCTAIISVDANNRIGCPHEETLARLGNIGAKVLRTDRNGNITCQTNGTTIAIETERPK